MYRRLDQPVDIQTPGDTSTAIGYVCFDGGFSPVVDVRFEGPIAEARLDLGDARFIDEPELNHDPIAVERLADTIGKDMESKRRRDDRPHDGYLQ